MVSFHTLLLDRAGNNLVNADFSPYSRMFFAVKHIYLTLYIVCMCSTAPICSVPLYLLAALAVPAARCARCGRRTSGPIASGRSSYLLQRPRPCAPARARVCAAVCMCVGARVAALASVVRAISFAYIVASPAVLPRAGLAVNFFEIVFKPSISVQLSSAGVGDTTLYCYTG